MPIIHLTKEARDSLRKFKKKRGMTYSGAVNELLKLKDITRTI